MNVVKQCFALPYLELPTELTFKSTALNMFSSTNITDQM